MLSSLLSSLCENEHRSVITPSGMLVSDDSLRATTDGVLGRAMYKKVGKRMRLIIRRKSYGVIKLSIHQYLYMLSRRYWGFVDNSI